MNSQIARSRSLILWMGVPILTALIVGVGVSLWHVTARRSYIIGVGAGLAAFLAPLPGLVEPETKHKWYVAIVLSAVIGFGVWFGVDDMAQERSAAERRLEAQREWLEVALRGISLPERQSLILSAAHSMRDRYHARQFVSVIDLAQIILVLDDDNGHALYYEGEAYRSLKNRTDLRDALQHYLAEATRRAEALDGDAAQCYTRSHGYCAERTAWVNHLMANDYYNESAAWSKARTPDTLLTAFRYEHNALQIRSQGFYSADTVESSCTLLRQIRRGMHATKQSTAEVEFDLRSIRCGA